MTADGHFDGHISTPNELYYIEPASRYFPGGPDPDFHSVIYSSTDVIHPDILNPDNLLSNPLKHGVPTCKSHELYLKSMEEQSVLEQGRSDTGNQSFFSGPTTKTVLHLSYAFMTNKIVLLLVVQLSRLNQC